MATAKQFRTVQQIMEHYNMPNHNQKPKTGKQIGQELAEKLLAEFRAKIGLT